MLKRNIIIRSLLKINWILPVKFKKQAIIVFSLLIFNSILELVGLGALVPLFLSILQPDAFDHGWLKYLFEFSGLDSSDKFIIALSCFILAFIIFKNIVSIWIVRYQAKFSFSLFTYITTQLQRYIYQKGFLYFKSRNHNEISRDVNSIPMLFTQNVLLSMMALVMELTVMFLIVIGISIYDPMIMLILAVIVVPVFTVFYLMVKNKITTLVLEANDIQAETGKNLYQSIFGYVDVMINNNKEWFFTAYKKNVTRSSEIRTKQFTYNMMPPKVIETTMIFGILVIIGYGVLMLPSREDLVILLGVFALAAYRILPSINRMMMSLMNVKSYHFTLEIVEKSKHLEVEEEIEKELSFNKDIQIKNLCYQYPGKIDLVLKNITVDVKKGQSIGFVGRSGSGKTTLINLLLGFIEPTKGQILIDNTPLGKSYLVSWRKLIGYVQQEVFLIDGSLAENIALGYGEIDENRVMEVVERASLKELISELPEGIYTQVGERGALISGGQRQRVGIARALYSGAKVLVFDEATSSLDNETEKEITKAINKLSGGDLTMFIIAHRHSTLKYCDKIIEVTNGELVNHEPNEFV